MKYLKYFDESIYENKELSSIEFFNYLDNSLFYNLNTDEKEKLSNLNNVIRTYKSITKGLTPKKIFENLYPEKFILETKKNIMVIYHMEDEWYLVLCEENDTNAKRTYFKCDSFKGLLKFIKTK